MRLQTLSASYTRPSDTTQYAANESVSDSTSSPSALNFGKPGLGWLIGAQAVDSVFATTLPQLRLFLFRSSPTAINDNSALTMTDAQLLTCVTYIDFLAWVGGDDTSGTGGNCITKAFIHHPVPLVQSNDDTLYGLVKVLNTYTPVSAEVFTFNLFVQQPD